MNRRNVSESKVVFGIPRLCEQRIVARISKIDHRLSGEEAIKKMVEYFWEREKKTKIFIHVISLIFQGKMLQK